MLRFVRKLFKKVFCKHNFQVYDTLPCVLTLDDGTKCDVPVTMLICSRCGKRKLIKDSDFCYNENLLQKLKLWERGEFDFEDYNPPRTIPFRRVK